MLKRSFTVSFLLHTSLLVLLLLARGGGEGNSNSTGKDDGAFIPKQDTNTYIPEPVEVSLISIPEKKQKPKKATKGLHECIGNNWYGGIGIREYLDGRIDEVAEGYAADRAGIKVGDILAAPLVEIRGEPGTTFTLKIDRAGKILFFDLTREKICIDPPTPLKET